MADDLAGKIALVTGANKGIGRETARQLGRRGATVLVGARDAGRGEEAAAALRAEGVRAEFLALDVNDPGSIRAAADEVERRHGRLDILVNNAAIANDLGIPAAETPLDKLTGTFQANVFGPYELIQAALPLLRKSDSGRIVNVSSTIGSLREIGDPGSPYDGNRAPAYQASKSALNAVTAVFARELRDTPIKINSVCPGWVRTDMGTDAAPRNVEQGATASVRYATLPSDGPTGGFFDENGPVAW